jgi:hypothetical protein
MHTLKQLKQFVALCFCEFESIRGLEKENVSGLKHSGITAFAPPALSFGNWALVCIRWLMWVCVCVCVWVGGCVCVDGCGCVCSQ